MIPGVGFPAFTLGKQGQILAYGALVAVCFFWGTTYLGIRMALESFPPLVLIASRFLLAGSILLAAALARGARIPKGRDLALTAVYGVAILGVGNSCLTYAETWIASGLASLFLTTSPFWLVGLEALMPGGEPIRRPVLAGLLIGLAGTALLMAPDPSATSTSHLWKGFLILQLGCVGWNLGSILQRRHRTSANPFVSAAIQQLATGLTFLAPALAAPGPPIHWSFRGVAALAYLVVFGSIVGYSAYLVALARLPVAVVSIYTYVNPLVAVALGWIFYREPFGWREAGAVLIIFAGVWIVKRFAHRTG